MRCGNNGGSDDAGGNRSEDVVAVDLAPLVTARRSLQVRRTVVHGLTAAPVLIAHVIALLLLVVADVRMIVVMVGVMVIGVAMVILGVKQSGREHCGDGGKSYKLSDSIHSYTSRS
jgi:hypothetical protein